MTVEQDIAQLRSELAALKQRTPQIGAQALIRQVLDAALGHIRTHKDVGVGTATPTHNADEPTLFWDRTNDQFFINGGGAVWHLIGGGSHVAVTVSGTPDYITLSGQDIVRGLIVLTTDVSGILPAANLPDASTAAQGVIEVATAAETLTGSSPTLAVSPNALNNANPDRTIVLTAGGGFPTATAGCAQPARNETPTNDVNYWTLDFDTGSDESAFWVLAMPDNYDGGTVTFVPYWTAASGSGTVAWRLAAIAYANSDALEAAYTDTGELSTDTLLTALDVHIGPESGAVTINGGPAAGELVQFRLTRDVSEDNLGVDAQLLSIRVIYKTSAFSD